MSDTRPVPSRGKGVDSTAYLDCPLCLDKFGTPTPVALTYMPTHLAKFHSELHGDYPEPIRERVAALRRRNRLVDKRRKLEAQWATSKSMPSRPCRTRDSRLPGQGEHRVPALTRLCWSEEFVMCSSSRCG